MKLTGMNAIEYAAAHGLTLSKYNDPIEDAREGLTPDEASKIALDDPSLIYVEMNDIMTTENGGQGGLVECGYCGRVISTATIVDDAAWCGLCELPESDGK